LFGLIFPLKKSGQKEYLRDPCPTDGRRVCELERSPDKSGESGREKHNPVIKYTWRIKMTTPKNNREITRKTIGQLLNEIAAKYPNNMALVHSDSDIRHTYNLFLSEINRAARV